MDQRTPFEMPRLTDGVSKLFLQSLLVGDENGVFSQNVVMFIL